MDALAGLLDGPRARGAFLLRAILEPPWSLRIRDEAPLTVVAVIRGQAWVVPDQGEPVQLRPGDVSVALGPAPYTVADHPATPPEIVICPGQRCTTLAGEDLHDVLDLGVRTWGNHPDGSATMLVGTYQLRGEIGQRLLTALPPLLVVPDRGGSPLLQLLGDELTRAEPGQEVILDRLLDLLLIDVLRAWFSRPEAEPPAWYRAHSDPVVGRALQLLHHHPDHPWTVAGLSAKAGASRAALARRFTELVGEPPMSYLTGWRWPPTCCGSRTPRSARWQGRWGTPARTRSAPRSSGYAGSARGSTGSAPPGADPVSRPRRAGGRPPGRRPAPPARTPGWRRPARTPG